METKHKPEAELPWQITSLGYLCSGPTILARTEAGPTHFSERIDLHFQDAAYIAHTANAYPKLVERLKEILLYQPEDEKTAALLRELGELE